MKNLYLIGIVLMLMGCASTRAMDYHWTAPSDNDKVDHYEAHRSCALDSVANYWKQCPIIPSMPTPSAPGRPDSVIGVQVPAGKMIYMCIKAYDPSGNESWCSNIDSTFAPDRDAPTAINDLTGRVQK